jgi:hypothetical protein
MDDVLSSTGTGVGIVTVQAVAYPLPAWLGNWIGTIAHVSVGLSCLLWAFYCSKSLGLTATEHPCSVFGSPWERRLFAWVGFWEAVGPVFLVAIPALCYQAVACHQRNMTHLLAAISVFGGVAWDVLWERTSVTRVEGDGLPNGSSNKTHWSMIGRDLGLAVFSSLVPAWFLFFHDHDSAHNTMADGDDAENVIHEYLSIVMGIAGFLRMLMRHEWFGERFMPLYLVVFACIGTHFIAAGPLTRVAFVRGLGLNGINVVFVCVLLGGIFGWYLTYTQFRTHGGGSSARYVRVPTQLPESEMVVVATEV